MPGESSVLVRLRLLGGQAFARQAQGAGRGLNTIGTAGQRVSTRLGGVNKALGATAVAMGRLAAGGAVAVGVGLAYGVKASANFEQAMANVQARLLTTKANMQLLSNQALDLGARTSFSAKQAADAMGEFAAAGFNTRQVMGLMPGTLNLAAASGTDLAFAAETTGALIRQFGLKATDATHVADLLTVAVNKSAINMDDLALSMKYVGPVAGRFNQSIEDVGAATAILGNVGIKGETAGTTLRRALVNIVKPSSKTVKVLKEMGITTGAFAKATINAKGDLRSMPTILGNLATEFKDLSKPDRRRALAQLFGVEALPGMITLFDQGEGAIRRVSRSLRNSGGAAAKTAKIMRGTVKGAWDQFTGSVETASVRLLSRFNPALRKGLMGASRLVGTLTTGVSNFAAGVGGAPAPKGKAVPGHMQEFAGGPQKMTAAQQAGVKVRAVLGGLVSWASANLPKLGAALLSAGRDLLDAFAPAMPFVQNVLLPLLKGIAIGVIGGVVAAFHVLVPVIKIVATVLGFVGKALAPLKGLFVGIGLVIGFVFGGAILKAIGLLGKVGGVFRLLAVPIRLAAGAFGFVIGTVGRLFGVFGRVLTGVQRFVGTFSGLPARIITSALNLVGGLINTLGSLPGRMGRLALRAGGRFISGLGSAITGGFTRVVGWASRLGMTVMNAVVDAIKGAPSAIVNALLDLVPGPVKGVVKSALGFITGAATGGTMKRGGWAVVGERGPELAKFPTGTTVYDHEQTAMASRGGRERPAMASAAGPRYLVANLHLSGKQIHSEVFRIDRMMAEAT